MSTTVAWVKVELVAKYTVSTDKPKEAVLEELLDDVKRQYSNARVTIDSYFDPEAGKWLKPEEV